MAGNRRHNGSKVAVARDEYEESYAPVTPQRDAYYERLEALEVVAAENSARLGRLEETVGYVQNVLHDMQSSGRFGGYSQGPGGNGGPVVPRGSHSNKMWMKERMDAWKNPTIRAHWLLCGDIPKACELSRVQLQGVLRQSALATGAVTEQLNALAGLDVLAFMPRGAKPHTAPTIDIDKQFSVLTNAVLLVVGRGVNSDGGMARMDQLRMAFDEGVDMVAAHGGANHVAMRMRVHKARIARFINRDLEDWTNALHDSALSAKYEWPEPPRVEDLPMVVVPTWAKIRAFLDAGGLENVDVQQDATVPGAYSNVRALKRTRNVEPTPMKCFGWASKKGCRYEQCRYLHNPADKFRPGKSGGGVGSSEGAVEKKAKNGAGAESPPPASSAKEEGSTNGGSPKPDEGTDK